MRGEPAMTAPPTRSAASLRAPSMALLSSAGSKMRPVNCRRICSAAAAGSLALDSEDSSR
ncbi:MAG: hypothetical protein WCF08_01150 [Anaerolineaceae bacterium]